MEETSLPAYFGEWLKHRRKELDLTQAELASRAGCSVPALRKIEAGERRPSKQLAGLLARSLEIPSEDQTTFIRAARGELNLERLGSSARAPAIQAKPAPPPLSPSVNLPVTLTPFIGRESELSALSQLLRDPQCRLLTLVGPGGIGKTRLAIEAAYHQENLFSGGIWFVPLAPLSSPAFIVPAIADALNFSFQDPTRPDDQLLKFLSEKQILLVLDNVEHLLDGVGLFSEILESCPDVKLLVTSRERLNMMSEWVFEIQGLPVPISGQVEQFEEYSSVALFLQSARRIQAGFDLSDDERQWAVRICQIVEGMPLGIELAAAWVGLLSCEEIAREIESNLDFLKVSLRDVPERHRSLRATLDHSWNLLDPEEKTVLSHLSVFGGSFRRRAAEVVCGASLMVLSSLKSKSLLRRTDQERYELHEIIQQYAALKLVEDANENERIKDKHAQYFAQHLSEWEKALKSSKQTETLSEMADEIDNLRQAWQRMTTCCGFDPSKNTLFSPDLFHSSIFSLSLFYEMRCRDWEAVSLFGKAAEYLWKAKASADHSVDQWPFDAVLGHLTAYLGLHHAYILQYQRAREFMEEALRLLQNDQAILIKAQAQIMLAWIYQIEGRFQKSIDLSKEAIAIFQEEDEMWWYALASARIAWSLLSTGKIQEGKALYLEGLRLIDAGDLCLRVPILNGLAYASYLENDYTSAERSFKENQERSLKLGNKRQTALCLLDLGQVALATGRIEEAEKNFQESIDLLSEFGESHDLALGLIYLGKCLTSRQETEAARMKFIQVIRIGKGLDVFHLVYWGLVNLARTYMVEGQSEKALEMARVLQKYSVEFKTAGNDGVQLLVELRERLSPHRVDAALEQTQDRSIESLFEALE